MNEIKEELRDILLRVLQGKTDGGEVLTFGDDQVLISREQCPAVLLSANKNLSEILLVQKFTQQKKRTLNSTTNTNGVCANNATSSRNGHAPTTNGTSNDDLDVTGSPLKCPFMQVEFNSSPFTIDLDLCENKKGKRSLGYTPIPTTKIGLIAAKLNLTMMKLPADEEFVPLWLVSDGKDVQRTLFIGIHRGKDTHTCTRITSGGPYLSEENLPSLDHLMKHYTATGPTKRVNSTVEATYSVLASEDEVRGSSLSLAFSWKRPLRVMSSPALDAHAIANVQVVCGDPRSPAHQMYLELCVLRGFVRGLETGEVSWYICEESKTVAQELKELFTSIMDKDVRIKREDEGGFDFHTMIQGKFENWRQNMDFTDCLWNILMRCESYCELKDNLSLICKAVAGQEVRPQIHFCNTTQLGSLLRSLMRGRGSLPEFEGFTPLKMLIEIGCEKIKRDYIKIFQAGDLVTGEQLSWFVGDEGSSSKDVALIVDQLERLHVALQVVVTLGTYLTLSLPSLASLTEQVLKQMKEEELVGAHSFSLKLDTLSVHKQIDSMKEDTWEVTFHGQEGNYSKVLMCHISHRPLFQVSSSDLGFDELQEGDAKEEDEEENDDKYFCTFTNSVTDRFLQ